jgi:hypothetical protein
LAPGRRQELEAEELSALRRSAVRRVADQRAVARPAPRPVRPEARLRRPAHPEAGQGVVADHPEVPSSPRLRREAAVYRDAPVRRQQGVSVFRPEARLSEAQPSKVRQPVAVLGWTAFPQALLPAFPAHAWCQREAARGAVAARLAVSTSCLRREAEVAWWLRLAALSGWSAPAVPRLREAAVGRDAGAAQPRAVLAELVVSAQPPVVARQEVSAAVAGPQRVAAAVPDAEGEPQQVAAAVPDAEGEPQREAVAVPDAVEAPQQAAEPAGVLGAAAEPQPAAV